MLPASLPSDLWNSSFRSLGPAVERALARGRKTFVSITAAVESLDPCALVFASRLASDRWFCWEQPDRDFALAAIGTAHQEISRGETRFRDVARACLTIGRERISSGEEDLHAGGGPVWTGAFAFA